MNIAEPFSRDKNFQNEKSNNYSNFKNFVQLKLWKEMRFFFSCIIQYKYNISNIRYMYMFCTVQIKDIELRKISH